MWGAENNISRGFKGAMVYFPLESRGERGGTSGMTILRLIFPGGGKVSEKRKGNPADPRQEETQLGGAGSPLKLGKEGKRRRSLSSPTDQPGGRKN